MVTLFSNDLYTDKMIEYINETQGDGKPLFMYLAFQVAHSPFMTPTEPWKSMTRFIVPVGI